MSNSAHAASYIKTMPESEQPLSEQYRVASEEYGDVNAAASLREELKTTTLEQMKTAVIREHGEMADNKAERIVKSSPEWEEYIRAMCTDRARADKLKMRMEYIRIKFQERMDANATNRKEIGLLR